jgi:uncharacterized phage protein (TIGR01671 family)
MREIKFRAWEVNKSLGGRMSKTFTLFDIHNSGFGTYGDSYTLMQFTGLKDKNGKDIYEGDVVKKSFGSFYWIGVLNFFGSPHSRFALENISHNVHNEDCIANECICSLKINGIDNLYDNQGEIIGNIYENPELIK